MKQCSRNLLGFSLFFIVLALLPLALPKLVDGGGRYELGVLNDIGIYTILALSLSVILGNCGIFNMGHAAFFAIGAYTTGILSTTGIPHVMESMPILLTLPFAGLLAGLFAFIIARPIIHLRGDYFLVVTIGIVEIIHIALVNNIFGITGGSSGIYGIPRPILFGFRIVSPTQFYYLIWGFAAITIILFILLENSRFGRALNYIKEDDLAAAGSGINVTKYKIMAFTLGAFFAGMAGTLFATKMRTISPDAFTFSESVLLFAIVILGGAGSISGVILGSFLLVGLPELFREFASARLLFYGAAMVLMMIFRPQGLLRPLRRRYNAKQYIGVYPYAQSLKLHEKTQRDDAIKTSPSSINKNNGTESSFTSLKKNYGAEDSSTSTKKNNETETSPSSVKKNYGAEDSSAPIKKNHGAEDSSAPIKKNHGAEDSSAPIKKNHGAETSSSSTKKNNATKASSSSGKGENA